jgi:hypothetical protein
MQPPEDEENVVSSLSSIFYYDEYPTYVHVARDGAEEDIYVEIGRDCDGDLAVRLTYEQAIEMATKILGYANWPDLINRRDMRGRTL